MEDNWRKMKESRKLRPDSSDMMKMGRTVNKRLLNELLAAGEEAYRASHPQTGELDIRIVRAYCQGQSVVRIGMETHCSESTVYRAIDRVRAFLAGERQTSPGECFFRKLQERVYAESPDFGDEDASTVLELLYSAFAELNNFDSQEAKELFHNIYEQLNHKPLREIDEIMDPVCTLCREYEKAGFTEGVKIGIRLRDELCTTTE